MDSVLNSVGQLLLFSGMIMVLWLFRVIPILGGCKLLVFGDKIS